MDTRKSNPPIYCPHCEEKIAVRVYYPYCSKWCKGHAS